MNDLHTAPDYARIVLITIDVQRDTLDGQPLEIPGTSAILAPIHRMSAVFREQRRPIVHMVRLYEPDGSNADLCRRGQIESGAKVLAPGSDGAELAPGVLPSPEHALDTDSLLNGVVQEVGLKEVIMYKPRWGAFYGTPLERHLATLGVTTLAFAGCNFPNCPRASIYEASERDFRIIAVDDGISGLYPRARTELRNIGVRLMRSDDLMQALTAA